MKIQQESVAPRHYGLMPRGGMLLLINIVALRRARLVLGWVTPIAGDPTDLCYGYVMGPGQLNIAY